MADLGVWLIVMGLGSVVLPYVGLQFRVLSALDALQPALGVTLALVGAAMAFLTHGSNG
jgi:hypothetical protein